MIFKKSANFRIRADAEARGTSSLRTSCSPSPGDGCWRSSRNSVASSRAGRSLWSARMFAQTAGLRARRLRPADGLCHRMTYDFPCSPPAAGGISSGSTRDLPSAAGSGGERHAHACGFRATACEAHALARAAGLRCGRLRPADVWDVEPCGNSAASCRIIGTQLAKGRDGYEAGLRQGEAAARRTCVRFPFAPQSSGQACDQREQPSARERLRAAAHTCELPSSPTRRCRAAARFLSPHNSSPPAAISR